MAKKSTDSTKDEELKDQNEEVEDDSPDETEDEDQDTEDEEDEQTDDESDDSDDEDEEDESDEDEEDAEGFKKRFTQIKGDTESEYLKNLENTYAEHSKEAVKLNRKNKELEATVARINAAVAQDPELAKALQLADTKTQKETPTKQKDPVLAWAEAERDKVWQKEYDDFLEAHPEVISDPDLSEKLNQKLAVVKRVTEEEEGRLVSMGEGLKAAWGLLGKDDTQEKVRMAAKDSASKGRSASGKKTASSGKTKFSDSQIEMMMNLQNVNRNQAIKLLAEYN